MTVETTKDGRYEIHMLESELAYIYDRRYDRQMHHAHSLARCLDWIAGYNQALEQEATEEERVGIDLRVTPPHRRLGQDA